MRHLWISIFVLSSNLVMAQNRVPVSQVSGAKLLWSDSVLGFSASDSGNSPEQKLLKAWGITRTLEGDSKKTGTAVVPVQTGRGLTTDDRFNLKGDVFLKGTGFNPETVSDVGRVRYDHETKIPKQGDGFFTVREAFADREASILLQDAGVVVAKPRAIISTGQHHPESGALMGIYAREFIDQTRLSNLDVMSDEEARQALDRAAERLYANRETGKVLSRAELFFFLMHRMAHTAATLQRIGYQHNYLHWQQVTLAGELCDLGTGTWMKAPEFSVFDRPSTIPYFQFSRQPLLMLNMFVRTHSLTADEPTALAADSETLIKQKNSLLGIYKRIDPQAAQQIERSDPKNLFWDFYREAEKELDANPPLPVTAKDVFSPSLEDFLASHSYSMSENTRKRLSEKFEALKKTWGTKELPHSVIRTEILGEVPRPQLVGRSAEGFCSSVVEDVGRVPQRLRLVKK